jgi:HAD superfamily hydrolase (TIGR01549 family)
MKAIIFDLYNTLVYSTVREKPYLDLFKNLGLTKEEMSMWRDKVMTQNFSSFEELAKSIKPKSYIYTDNLEYIVKKENEHTHVFDDTYSVLERLSKKYKLYLLSNIATPYKECFYNLGLDKYIQNTYFSCDIGYRKPQPEAFEMIIKDSGLNPNQILMVGDSIHSDYEGALNCGLKAILKDKPLSFLLSEY